MNPYLLKIKHLALDNKYTKYYCNIIDKALSRSQDRKSIVAEFGYAEFHHILPKSFKLGGEKDSLNTVLLTAKEHFIVHLCATKMFESIFKNKMIFAFRQLRSSNKYQDRYINSRFYSKLKNSYKGYIRFYKEDQVKYIYEEDSETKESLIRDGWSLNMTPEYKAIGIPTFRGRKHSDDTKRKIGDANKHKQARKFGPRSLEAIENMKQSIAKRKHERPKEYKAAIDKRAASLKKMHEDGLLDLSGDKNGMFGKHHSEESKKLISEISIRNWSEIKSDPEKYEKVIDRCKKAANKTWKSQELRERHKIISSKAYRKYKMEPKEFYKMRIKPLIYMGFLPTSIFRYGLLDFCKNHIKQVIFKEGSEMDKKQFHLNKVNAAGSNKAYIKFLSDQYEAYFKDKDVVEVLEKLIMENPNIEEWTVKYNTDSWSPSKTT